MFGFAENDIYSLGQVFTPFPASAATGQAFPHRFLPPSRPSPRGEGAASNSNLSQLQIFSKFGAIPFPVVK